MNFLTHIPVIFQSVRQSQRGCDKTQKCFVTAPFPFYKKDGGHTATRTENHFICANISSGKQSQHNTAGNRRTKHACQIRPHGVHEKKYIPAFLLPYKMRNAGSNRYGCNTC